ncbi:GNAT family N-acetyltransferase [Streptomyces sp. NPDC020917]|uniref:GNAT family N-acetyltransferase n=1 Tax=Streptomyces sp. NPDC020917 TaxID=3365102 RepID=UPI0037A13A58
MDTLHRLPVLAAGDYVLRRWELTDLPVVEEAAGDPYIPLVNTVPAAYTYEAGVAFVERQWGRPATGLYPFAIGRPRGEGQEPRRDGSDDRPGQGTGSQGEGEGGSAVGHAGLRLVTRDRASVGYWVAPSARRSGAARSALRAITEWGLHDLGIARLELHIEPWNAGSLRTAESCGYQREGLMRDWMRVGGELRDAFMYTALRTPR